MSKEEKEKNNDQVIILKSSGFYKDITDSNGNKFKTYIMRGGPLFVNKRFVINGKVVEKKITKEEISNLEHVIDAQMMTEDQELKKVE